MSGKPIGLPDIISSWTAQSGAKGIVQGGAASGVGLALLSGTFAIPDPWEAWVQWPCYGLFVVGVVKSGISGLLSPRS